MKVHFRINYCTVWGEEVRIKLQQQKEVEIIYPLSTVDGVIWSGEMAITGDAIYQYCIYYNGQLTRSEWNVNDRCIYDDGTDRTFLMNDAWCVRSDLSYFYSSAFTRCVRRSEKDLQFNKRLFPVHSSSPFIVLHVSAPQLEGAQSLSVCGNQKILGNWDPEKAAKMKHGTGNLEWILSLDVSKLIFPLEYKFCVYNKETEQMIDWESGNSHFVHRLELHKNEVYVISDITVYFPCSLWKGAGVAIPVFSLKTEKSFGVGDFGDLKRLIDWAALTHQRVVQILPINDTVMTHTWADSYPYSSLSIYAFHPMYMNIDKLGKLNDKQQVTIFSKKRKELNDLKQIDYEEVNKLKWEYIRLMFKQEGTKVLASDDFKTFFTNNRHWLVPYAAFSYLRDKYGTPDFHQWEEFEFYDEVNVYKLCIPGSKVYQEIAIYYYVQYNLHLQLLDASNYARRNQVILKGDIPIGISRTSVEAWTEPHYFNMDGQAGAPPDDFSEKGQNWGFPTYNWEEMHKDGYRWWKRRLKHMSGYFDAYRIDHILGFFRIWEIPTNSVHGLLGQFVPSIPMSIGEIQSYGLSFRRDFFTRPHINDYVINKVFGPHAEMVKDTYLRPYQYDLYEMRLEYDTQRKVEAAFVGKTDKTSTLIREGLYSLISDVLFIPDRNNKEMFHPRIAVQFDFVYETLSWEEKQAFNRLYNDYYYRRHNDFWYHGAMKKLPELIDATRMLVCGEDLGMVPDCVASVLNELHILSLEIQRMPKNSHYEFGHVYEYPYRSVCTFSSHDTSTLRGCWEEDSDKTARFFHNELNQVGDVPQSAPGWVCELILNKQLYSPSMLCILTFQDWLSMDEDVRNSDVQGERINVPADAHHYWRYRMHLTLEELLKNDTLNEKIKKMIDNSGRNIK